MKTLSLLFSVLIMVLMPFQGNSQARYVDEVFSAVTVTSNIQYGANKDRFGTNTNLVLDIYQPTGDTATVRPLIIIAHEGSFLAGSKTDIECVNYANKMAKRGYVVASIDYRMGWTPGPTASGNAKEIVPALWRAMQDGKAAVRFFRKNVAVGGNTYKIDTSRIATGGFGAGSYIFIHNEYFDLPVEFNLPKVKDSNGQPYIDTMALGGFEGESGNPGYEWRSDILVNYAGAIGDTAFYNEQRNDILPIAITVHSDLDQTTPYGTAIVFAGGQFPVLEVSGGYEMARKQYEIGKRDFEFNSSDGFPQYLIKDPNGRGFPKLNIYKMGTYTFLGKDYQPWAYNTGAAPADIEKANKYMDSLVRYTAPRLASFFFPQRAPLAKFSSSTDGLTVEFTDNSTFLPTSWAWDFGDGNSSSEKNPTHVYAAANTYTVTLIASNDIGSDTTSKEVSAFSTGIKEHNLANRLQVFPNPAMDNISIQLKDDKIQEIRILNLQGKLIQVEKTPSTNSVHLNVNHLQAGAYLVEVKGEKTSYSQSIIKK